MAERTARQGIEASPERLERVARVVSTTLTCSCALLEGRGGGSAVLGDGAAGLDALRAIDPGDQQQDIWFDRSSARGGVGLAARVRVPRASGEATYVRFGWEEAPKKPPETRLLSDIAATVVDILDIEAYGARSTEIVDLVPHAIVIEVPGRQRVLTNSSFDEYLERASKTGINSLRDIIDIELEDLEYGETQREVRTVDMGEEQRVFEVSMRRFRRWTADSDAIMAVMTDLTSIQQSEEELRLKQRQLEAINTELERSNQELEQFAYVASHDLQEPLRMVSSFLSLLVEEYEDVLDDEAREYVAFAVDGARRMKSMINELLAFSRIRTRDEPVEMVDVAEVVADAIDEIEQNHPASQVEFSVGGLPKLPARPGQIRRVFANLFINALKHGDRDDVRIRIESNERPDAWEFAVIDNGVGVPEQQQARIFDIFVRGSRDDNQGGSGIGLAVCATVVAKHGGRIWVDDAEPEGAAFRFTISKELADGE